MMRERGMRAGLLLLCLAGPACAADTVRLMPGHAAFPGVQGTPRVVAGVPDAVRGRINRALAQADARGRSAARACTRAERAMHPEEAGDSTWSRQVEVTGTGPRWLSVLITDGYDCAGPHPFDDLYALVFELRTGRLVDWAAVLPPDLAGSTVAGTTADGARVGIVRSPGLLALAQRDAEAECAAALRDDAAGFVLWPAADGLTARPVGMAHINSALCGAPIVLPGLGVTPASPRAAAPAPAPRR